MNFQSAKKPQLSQNLSTFIQIYSMDWALSITTKNRIILERFLKELSLEQLNKVPTGFNNNIIWNIAHTVVTQQLLVYSLSGLEPIVPKVMIDKYRKGTKPEGYVTHEEVDIVNGFLFSTIDQTYSDLAANKFKEYQVYTVTTKSTLTNVEEAIEFNNFHEGLHLGYILALKRAI